MKAIHSVPRLAVGILILLLLSAGLVWAQTETQADAAAEDGWDSESMHLRIEAQLREVRTLIEARDATPASWETRTLLSDGITATSVLPDSWEPLYGSKSLRAWEGTPDAKQAHAGVEGWAEAIKTLIA